MSNRIYVRRQVVKNVLLVQKGFINMKLFTVCVQLVVVALLASAVSAGEPQGLHVKKASNINFNNGYHVMTDGGGFRWDIQHYGTVYNGSNYAYCGGMYFQLNGSNFRVRNNTGIANKAGDEIELGPWKRNNLQIHRRVKVYNDAPLARWLEIMHNPTSQDITINARLYSSFNYGMEQFKTTGGGGSFGPDDWAYTLKMRRNGSPYVMHIVAGEKASVRPGVRNDGSNVYVTYNVVVPAGKTAIICSFAAQNNDLDTHQKFMKKFRPSRYLRDLPPAVRGMIINMKARSGFAGVDLDRDDSADVVFVNDRGIKKGRITNKSFRAKTFFGPLDLPAEKVIGMAAAPGDSQSVRFVLSDGQIICSAVPEGKINLALPTGGELNIPFDRIGQWSYRVSESRGDDIAFAGPAAVLRTGDRLLFDPDALKLTFRTRHGGLSLQAKDLLSVVMDNPDNGMHRAMFLNGSSLGGILAGDRVSLQLKLGKNIEISRHMLMGLEFAEEEAPDPTLSKLVLSNGDELFGKLAEKEIEVADEFGNVRIKPRNILWMAFSSADAGWAAVKLWDDTDLAGRISPNVLSFNVVPGPTIKLNAAQIVSIASPETLPPDEMVAEARKHIACLGRESFKDRQEATEKLIKMGKPVAPLLRKHLSDTDPEVRQRIEQIIEAIGADKTSKPTRAANPQAKILFRN